METFWIVFWTLFYLLSPAGVIWLCRRSTLLAKVGSILLLYILGILVGNLFIFPFDGMAETLSPVQNLMISVAIPLAMPLILFACDFRHWPVKKAMAALIIGLVSVLITVALGYFLFRDKLGEQASSIAGMAVGVYTGGTPNLAAIKMMLGVDEGTYVLMNSFDMLVSFVSLIFLMTIGIRLIRSILHVDKNVSRKERRKKEHQKMAQGEQEMYRDIFTKKNFLPTLEALGLSILIAGIGIGLSMLLTGKVNMVILILTITTLAIAASFLPTVQKWEKSYDAGMYLVLIFSVVVASMVDFRSLHIMDGIWLMAFITFIIFGSLALQVILGKIFKVDADTTIITSVAMINSPLFVPMIADAMKNRKVILTGITIGIIGYAVGNYLGVLMANILP